MKSRKISASARRLDDQDPHRAHGSAHQEDGLGRQPDAEAIRDGGLDAAGEGDDIARLGAVASQIASACFVESPTGPSAGPACNRRARSATRPKASPGRPAAASAASRVAGA